LSKPSPPAPPDYRGAAIEQGRANVNSAVATNYLNQANQVGPNGTLTYTYGNNMTLPDGSVVPQATATTTLSPDQQTLYDQNIDISRNLNETARAGIGYVQQAFANPLDTRRYMPSTLAAPEALDGTIAKTSLSQVGGPGQVKLQDQYDFSKVTAAPSVNDYVGARDQITNAMLERLRPQMERDQQLLETRNSNQGIFRGSEANNWDQQNLDKSQNDLKIAALLAGNQQQQADFANTLAVHNADVGQAIASGNFTNQARNDAFGQAATSAQITNQAQANQAAQAQADEEARNRAAAQTFNQGLAAAQFNNQAQQQALQMEAYGRNDPLNTLNALRTGNQATIPTFGNATAGSTIQAAPLYQATNDQYNAQMAQYQAQMAAQGGFLGGLGSIGGSLASTIHWSDRRLKEGVEVIGRAANNLQLYVFNYIWDKTRRIGHMADEVEKLFPEAVITLPSGYKAVDYGKVN